MFGKLEIVRMAQALTAHAGARQGEIARNIANADTPGFKARDLAEFGAVYAGEQQGMRATRSGHLGQAGPETAEARERLLPGAASPDGNTVALDQEMVRAVEVRQQHDMALAVYRSTATILRRSLGRAG